MYIKSDCTNDVEDWSSYVHSGNSYIVKCHVYIAARAYGIVY